MLNINLLPLKTGFIFVALSDDKIPTDLPPSYITLKNWNYGFYGKLDSTKTDGFEPVPVEEYLNA